MSLSVGRVASPKISDNSPCMNAAVELELPTAVLRMRKAQSECRITVTLRKDVHHIGGITLDVDWLLSSLRF